LWDRSETRSSFAVQLIGANDFHDRLTDISPLTRPIHQFSPAEYTWKTLWDTKYVKFGFREEQVYLKLQSGSPSDISEALQFNSGEIRALTPLKVSIIVFHTRSNLQETGTVVTESSDVSPLAANVHRLEKHVTLLSMTCVARNPELEAYGAETQSLLAMDHISRDYSPLTALANDSLSTSLYRYFVYTLISLMLDHM